jgi:hypothetical protein
VVTCSLFNTINVVVEMIASDSSGKFHVFFHYGGSFGVDGAEVGVFEDSYKVCF